MDSKLILQAIINEFLHKLSIEEVAGELFLFTPFQDAVGNRIVLNIDNYKGTTKVMGKEIVNDIFKTISAFNVAKSKEDSIPVHSNRYNNNVFFDAEGG